MAITLRRYLRLPGFLPIVCVLLFLASADSRALAAPRYQVIARSGDPAPGGGNFDSFRLVRAAKNGVVSWVDIFNSEGDILFRYTPERGVERITILQGSVDAPHLLDDGTLVYYDYEIDEERATRTNCQFYVVAPDTNAPAEVFTPLCDTTYVSGEPYYTGSIELNRKQSWTVIGNTFADAQIIYYGRKLLDNGAEFPAYLENARGVFSLALSGAEPDLFAQRLVMPLTPDEPPYADLSFTVSPMRGGGGGELYHLPDGKALTQPDPNDPDYPIISGALHTFAGEGPTAPAIQLPSGQFIKQFFYGTDRILMSGNTDEEASSIDAATFTKFYTDLYLSTGGTPSAISLPEGTTGARIQASGWIIHVLTDNSEDGEPDTQSLKLYNENGEFEDVVVPGQTVKLEDDRSGIVFDFLPGDNSISTFVDFATPYDYDGTVAFTSNVKLSDSENPVSLVVRIAEECSAPFEVGEAAIEADELRDLAKARIADLKRAIKRVKGQLKKGKKKAKKRDALQSILSGLKAELKEAKIQAKAAEFTRSFTREDLDNDDKSRYVRNALCGGTTELHDAIKRYQSSQGLKPNEFVDGLDALNAVLDGTESVKTEKGDKALKLLIKSLVNQQFGGEAKDLTSEALKIYELVKKKLKAEKPELEIGKEAENLAKTIFKSVGKARFGKDLAGAVGEVGRGIVVISEIYLQKGDPTKQFEVLSQYVETLLEKFFVDLVKEHPAAYAGLFGYSLAKPIGDSIAKHLGFIANTILADACLRVLEKAQSKEIPGVTDPDVPRPDGAIGSFSCYIPRSVQITKDTLPGGGFAENTCTLHSGAANDDKPGHCLIEITPPSTFYNGVLDFFGQGPKKKYFDAAFVNRRSI